MPVTVPRRLLPGIRAAIIAISIAAIVSCQSEQPTEVRLPGEVSLAKGGGGGGGGGGNTDLVVSSTDPASAIQDTSIAVTILGSGFSKGATATWSLNGDTTQVSVKSTKFVNSGKLIAQVVVPATATVGSYDVIVTLSNGKKGVGAEMFKVEVRPLYRMRLISGINPAGDGELTSDWFPATGFRVTTNNPWAALPVSNTTLYLTNFTHGDITQGKCAEFIANFGLPLNIINWDVAGTNPVRSYAGTWGGQVTIARGYMAFDGDRVVNGAVVLGAGGIHNVVTQNNTMYETVGPNYDWFRQEVRNAAFKMGGASTPDGADLPGSELACINYTVELRKTSLIP